MGRKLDIMGRKVDVLDRADMLEDLKQMQDVERKEQLIFTNSSDWTPEQAEQYIDWRIQQVDAEIGKLRQQLDDLTAMRKRWLAVTGGRSRVVGGNGHETGGE